MNRRNFLKASAGIGTLGALRLNADATANLLSKSADKEVCSVCEMCSSRCPIQGRIKDGKCDLITGNPHFSANKTSVCARGGAGVNQLYDDQRLVKPLIRTGERGSGQFREASWDEALKFAADKLKEISEKYGPQSVVFTSKAGESHGLLSGLACAYGSPNIFSHWSCCPISDKIASTITYGTGLKRDFANAKYILNFGHNLFEGINISDTKRLAKSAAKADTKLVVLEPRFSVVASKADEWIPVRPGTDLAFVMALIHVWLRDDKFDKDFVEKFTVGIDELRAAVKDSSPKWQEPLTGIKAEVVERIADEIYKAAPKVIIDWGHKTTTSRAEFQRTRAIMIANALMGNIEKVGGIHFGKNSGTFNKLVKEDMFPTITNPDAGFKVPKTARIDGCGEAGKAHFFIPRKHGVLMDIVPAILEEKPYPVKGWVNSRFNYLINVAGEEKAVQAIKKLDFILSVDIYMNDFTQFADVILPVSTYLERDESIQDKSGSAPGFYMRNKMVEPIGDTKGEYEVVRALAKAMGYDDKYSWSTVAEYRMQQAKGDDKLLAKLIQDGFVTWKVPKLYYLDKSYVGKFVEKYPQASEFVDEAGLMSSQMKFKTPSGKVELFSAQVEEALPGEGCLHTRDMDCYDGHELCLMTGKTPIHTNGHTQNVKVLNDMMSESPIWINPKTAAKRGLKDGDKVLVKNQFSSGEAKIMVTEGIREDALFMYHGFGHISKGLKRTHGVGLNQSKLLNPADGPVCGTMVTNVGVDISKA